MNKLSLKDSELRYRRLFEAAQDGILILNASTGMIEDVNPYLIEMLGYSHQEFLQKRLCDVGAFSDVKDCQIAFEKLQVEEFVRYEDLPLKTKKGRLINVEFVSNAYYFGKVKVIQCNIRDITERKINERKCLLQLDHLLSISSIDKVITTNFDLQFVLREILIHVTKELGVDSAVILILNSRLGILTPFDNFGFRNPKLLSKKIPLGKSLAGQVALDRKMLKISDLSDESIDSPFLESLNKKEDFVCYFGVPLLVHDEVNGVMEVYNRSHLNPDSDWFDFFVSLAGQAAIAIEINTLFTNLQSSNSQLIQAYDSTIEGWSRALDLRDKETEGHTQRVTKMAVDLASTYGLNDEELLQVRWGSLLHDIGKLGVPDRILLKKGPLTEDEWAIMKKHPIYAYEMLAPIDYLHSAVDIPYYHHEKWDGSGYPKGLKGNEIPLIARIFAIVDVWDALHSNRPYRKAWSDKKVIDLIKASSNTHFDPKVVEDFLRMNDGKFSVLSQLPDNQISLKT